MIKIKNLTKKYGNIYAIKNLTFEVEQGEIIGFLGPNGAGKSTTMNILTGYMPATSGEAEIDGYNIMDDPMEVKKRIGYLPEIPPLYLDMRVKEYLKLVAELKKVSKKDAKTQIEDVMEKLKITDVQNRKIDNLSKGYRQRVGFAQALIGNPDVLILDEPTVGLDPQQIIEIRELIKSLRGKHTVILSSHILSEVSEVCNRVIIIKKGEIVAVDTPDNLSTMIEEKKNLELTLESTQERSLEIVKAIEGVEKVEVCKENDGIVTYKLECDYNIDVEKNIFFTLSNEQIPVRELKKLESSLEDVFLKIINSNQKFKVEENDEELKEEEETQENSEELKDEEVTQENSEELKDEETKEESSEELKEEEVTQENREELKEKDNKETEEQNNSEQREDKDDKNL